MGILSAVILGFILDLILGDPQWIPHPVRFIGFLISNGENVIRKCIPKREFIGGMILTIFVVSTSFIVPFLMLFFAEKISIYLKIILETIFIYQILATKSLKTESMRVYKYLEKNDIFNSRKYLSWIVGRDTEKLDEKQITKATIETVAENTSDGVIAPLIYIIIGGAPLGFLYKAINTLDSMIGYKNDKYMYFGRFAARLDDVANFIPAIVASYIMILGSFILKLDYKNAFKIYKRDRYNCSSPNCAKTESVTAGALQVQLLGDAYYFGKLVKKKTIGDDIRPVKITDIIVANKLMYTTAVLSVLLFSTLRFLGMMLL